MSTTYEERRAKRLEFGAVTCPAIAQALTQLDKKLWQVQPLGHRDPDSSWRELVSADGEFIGLSYDEYGHRIAAHAVYGTYVGCQGSWVPGAYAPQQSPSPTMSASKTPAHLAADLCKRYLPQYRVVREEFLTRKAGAEAYAYSSDALAKQIRAAGKGLIDYSNNQPDSTERNLHFRASEPDPYSKGYGDLRVMGDSVRVDLTVSGAVALKIAAILGDV